MKRKLFATALAMLATPLAAHAQSPNPHIDVQSIEVAYGDLNLSKPEDARKMLGRIVAASKRVCGPPGRELELVRSWKSCVIAAANTAVAELNAPMVTALHNATDPISGQFASARTQTD